jgi:hypothetical protein
MNRHQNEQISLTQMLKQQTQTEISIPTTTYNALITYCQKNKLDVSVYVSDIIMKSITSAK